MEERMKNAKKFLALLLAALTLLSIAACAGNDSKDTSDASAQSGAETNEKGEVIPPVPTVTYDGHEFTVLMTNRNADAVIVRDFDMTEENSTANVLNEALYRRNTQMEEEFDIVINPIVKYASQNNGTQLVQTANTSEDSTYDMCVLGTYSAATLSQGGDLADLSSYGNIDLSKSWWDQNINRDIAVGGKVFFTTGDISLVATQAMYGLVFNKKMFDERSWDYPYETVKEGKWTFDTMKSYALQVSDDLNADQKRDQYDLYGFGYINSTCMAFLGAAGEKIAKVNDDGEIELSIARERVQNAIVSFVEMTKDSEHTINGQTQTDGKNKTAIGMFRDGQLLFRAVEHLGFPHLRDTELSYGIIPLPKFTENQDRYYTPVGGWDGAYVCIPTSTEDVERTSTIIERTAYISQQIVTPAYYEKTLEGKYVRDDDSYDMITLEIENRTYDIGLMFNFGGLQDRITDLSTGFSTNFMSMLTSTHQKAQSEIDRTNADFKNFTNDAE